MTRTGSFKAAVSLMLLACAIPARAAGPDSPKAFSASGYLKELWETSHSALSGQPYNLNLDRARLTLDGRYGLLRAHVDYDQELYAGNYWRTPEAQAFGLGEPSTWLGLSPTINKNTTALWRHKLYRGWAGLEDPDKGVVRFGRQRIAWGTGKLWNPTDVLNPYQPLSVERADERIGVDAAYARYALGELSQLEAVYTPQNQDSNSAALARAHSHIKDYDWSIVGGKVQSSTNAWMAGGDFAGNFLDGTLHGEWSYTNPVVRTSYWKADVGYDYTFPDDSRIPGLPNAQTVVEYFHNGAGAAARSQYNPALVLSGQQVALARDYLGFTFSKDLTTLWKLELALIQNLNDASLFASPSIQWNALNNLYLTAAWQRFGGPKNTELGRAANLTYLQAQYYF